MTNQEIARQRFKAFDAEMTAFIFGAWAKMTDIKARDAMERAIEEKHEYVHGWIYVNGEGFCKSKAFPEIPEQPYMD